MSLCLSAQAVDYAGNGNSGWGGAVGLGTLSLTHTPTDLSFTLTKGAGSLDNALVIYIDSVAGGFTDTSTLSDDGDGARSAISGYTSTGNSGGPGRSTMTFLSGFEPEYAVAIEGGYASLFGLASGGQWSLNWIAGANQSGSGSSTFSLSFPLANIGVGVGDSFDLFGTYSSPTGYRSQEAIAGNDFGTDGWNPFTQTAFVTYMIPEPGTFSLLGLGLAGWLCLRRRS